MLIRVNVLLKHDRDLQANIDCFGVGGATVAVCGCVCRRSGVFCGFCGSGQPLILEVLQVRGGRLFDAF